MRIAIAGLGLIGGSMALALKDAHDVRGYDPDAGARAAAAARGIAVVERLAELAPADAIVVAAPLAAVVPTLGSLAPIAGDAVLIEVGSLKSAVAAFAERAPKRVRIVGVHPMAGSTASGFIAADPALFRGRPFLVVPTARSDDSAMAVAGELGRALGGIPTVCSVSVHDRAMSAVSALPLAAAVALTLTASRSAGVPLAGLAGPGLRDATRLASTPADLAVPLLRDAAALREDIAGLREALAAIERAIGDDASLRALLDRAREARRELEG